MHSFSHSQVPFLLNKSYFSDQNTFLHDKYVQFKEEKLFSDFFLFSFVLKDGKSWRNWGTALPSWNQESFTFCQKNPAEEMLPFPKPSSPQGNGSPGNPDTHKPGCRVSVKRAEVLPGFHHQCWSWLSPTRPSPFQQHPHGWGLLRWMVPLRLR